MAGLIVSTIAYFVAAWFLKRQLDEMQVPKGMTRSIVIFTLALAVAYGAGFVADWIAG